MNKCNVVEMYRICFWNKRNAVKIFLAFKFFFVLLNVMFYTSQRWTLYGSWPGRVTVNDSQTWFLGNYTEHCQTFMLPKTANVEVVNVTERYRYRVKQLCPCVPETLIGTQNITVDAFPPLIGELELLHFELLPGGQWLPKTCVPRQRIAVIVPFRDRELHLRHFLGVIHPFLQRQMLHYTIFVVEQAAPNVFNKASLMNVGFLEAQLSAEYDCYIFHDVDMLPETDFNFYTCSNLPRHVGSHLDKFNYELPYPELFGGVTAFNREHFILVNGFSNQYYGWGGEDDDMYYRILARNLTFVRFPETIARYTMIKHDLDAGNPMNRERLKLLYNKNRERIYTEDGLNSVRYSLRKTESRPLYTWLYVELPPHPADIDRDFWANRLSKASDESTTLHWLTLLSIAIFLLNFS